jgi:CheY-like chemotaxis protein
MEPAHEAGDSAGEADCDEETQRTLRLLIVEDHRATLDVLKRLLTRDGHYVVGAGTVSAALAAAGETDFDVVISDLGLPDGTGIELMEKLRAHHGLRGIALSGYGMEKDTERTREAGFMAHLIKPIDFNQLRHTLESLE